MTRIRLDFIHEFIDRHGKVRRYFRRPGFKRVRLPGLPGSAEFMEAYQVALAGVSAPRLEIGASRTRPGTVNAAVVAFYGSNAFLKLRAITKATYRGILEGFRAKHGDKRISMLERRHILAMLADKAAAPAAQRNLLRMLRMLLAFAVEAGLRADNPAVGIKTSALKSVGFHTWTEEEIARDSRRTMRSAPVRGSPWRSCSIPHSGVPMSCASAGSTFATALSISLSRRPATRWSFRCTPNSPRSSLRHRATT